MTAFDDLGGGLASAAAHLSAQRYGEARAVCDRLAAAYPDHPEVLHVRGLVLFRQGETEAGIEQLGRSLELRPESADVLANLGAMQEELGNDEAALGCFAAALELAPGDALLRYRVGRAQARVGDNAGAEASYRAVLAALPDFADGLFDLGVVLRAQGRLDEALAAFRRTTEIKPDHAAAWNSLGIGLQIYGQYDAAVAAHRRFLEIRPDAAATAFRNIMTTMLFDPGVDEAARWSIANEFAARCGAAPTPTRSFANKRDARRPLRIGYIGSDFYDHPVGRNLEPVLSHRDRSRFQLACYSDVARPDVLTACLRGLADLWRPIKGLTDAQVADQVRADGVDILVILAGRFDQNRPQVATYRPAPVCVSFHDPGTSGLSTIEYLIADPVLVPRRHVERFSERVVRLPGFYVHAPLDDAPPVGALPAAQRGFTTFASFNNPSKLNDAVLSLWGEVLRAVPNSRLKLKYRDWFKNAGLRDRVLAEIGVERSRIVFVAEDAPAATHLGSYADVDIALDPFPFTGSTTTFEALWMGVPVVTLLGSNMAGRWSASILRQASLDALVARDRAAYVASAVALAGDLQHLASLRAGLRARVARSPLCDGAAKAPQIERLYRAMWRRWCGGASG
jgi:protein O-GlcNAc transferase